MEVKSCTLIKPLHCNKKANLVEVARMLKEAKQRRIIVIDDQKKPVGIISTTDISNKVVAEGKDVQRLTAEEIMTSPIYLVCDMDDDINGIFKKMIDHEAFFVPVVSDNKLHGILTYGELMKCIHHKTKNGNK